MLTFIRLWFPSLEFIITEQNFFVLTDEEMQTLKKKASDKIYFGKPRFILYKCKISSFSPLLPPNTIHSSIQVCNLNCGVIS